MIAGLALLAALASCGGSTEEAAAPVMPDVVGRLLDTALNEINSAGFKEKVDVAGGGTFGIVEEANWQVCTQSPEAGSSISTAPQLSVKRLCEDSTEGTTTTSSPASSPSPSDPPATQPACCSCFRIFSRARESAGPIEFSGMPVRWLISP